MPPLHLHPCSWPQSDLNFAPEIRLASLRPGVRKLTASGDQGTRTQSGAALAEYPRTCPEDTRRF